MQALRAKPITGFFEDGDEVDQHGAPRLARRITLLHLTMLGVGATIGTGIFVALTAAVPEAGPGVLVSFVIAGSRRR
jgi:APA family basic amino acid/polyamine antiporter